MQKLLIKGIGHKKFKKVKWLFGKTIEIPEEWEVEQFKDNFSIKGRIGWQGLTTKEYKKNGKHHLVTGTDFKGGRIMWDSCVYVDVKRYNQDKHIQLKINDVLITKDGTIGKIALIDKLPIPATLNTGIFVVRSIEHNYMPKFIYYVLKSAYFIKFLNILKAGSTISHLFQKDFEGFAFIIPPNTEQQKIAFILSNIDSQITVQSKYKEKLERLKKSLMQKLLTGEIRVKV